MDIVLNAVTADISTLVDEEVAPNYIIKLKSELAAIDRISHRVRTIRREIIYTGGVRNCGTGCSRCNPPTFLCQT